MTVVQRIRAILEQEADFKMNGSVTDDDALIESGVADSFGMITLVVLLEKEFDFKVSPEEMSAENFVSIGSIARYVGDKLGAGDRG
jgi:acyl carrier protein